MQIRPVRAKLFNP